MHAPRQAVNKQANKDSILFIDLEIRFIEVKDIISSYKGCQRWSKAGCVISRRSIFFFLSKLRLSS